MRLSLEVQVLKRTVLHDLSTIPDKHEVIWVNIKIGRQSR